MGASSTLDRVSVEEARTLLTRCCGAHRWVDAMIDQRPFHSVDRLLEEARRTWFSLDAADWREAFAHHPKIGDRAGLQARFAATRQLSANEQSGVDSAPDAILDALERGNRLYEERFGFIFIVCATGKSAAEMLALLESRLGNAPDVELGIAAEEQARITALRLLQIGT